MILKLILVGLIGFHLSGCADKQPEAPKVIYVPQKCVIPQVPYPDIDNNKYTQNPDIVAKALSNYIKMKEYADKLLTAQKVCE